MTENEGEEPSITIVVMSDDRSQTKKKKRCGGMLDAFERTTL